MNEIQTSQSAWLLCPVCGNKTRIKVQKDTVLQNFLLFCPKSKNETLVDVREMKMMVINETNTHVFEGVQGAIAAIDVSAFAGMPGGVENGAMVPASLAMLAVSAWMSMRIYARK